MKKICAIYAIDSNLSINKSEFTLISGSESNPRTKQFLLITILTSPEARRKAELDIFVERRLDSSKIDPEKINELQVKTIAREFGKTKSEIIESIKRIIALQNTVFM